MEEGKMTLRPCPFCGEQLEDTILNVLQFDTPPKWVVTHYCNLEAPDLEVVISCYGSTKEEAVERWNGRRGASTEEGGLIYEQ